METWQLIETAPRDGTLFDAMRNGIRFTDCQFDEHGRLFRVHSYPSVTTRFRKWPTHWMPRPAGLIAPYEVNDQGEKYVPGAHPLIPE